MIKFRNQGTIDPRAFQVFGLSSKDQSKIGRFGTGMKYAIATIIRGSGSVVISSGGEQYEFTTQSLQFRDTEHETILCNGKELGYTTSLGKDWKPWMAFRELYSNVLDEDGKIEFEQESSASTTENDETVVSVDWQTFDAIYFSIEEHFIGADETPLFDGENLQVFPGQSKFVFYRGIAVHELKKPAAFRYNLKTYISLTEDRTAQYPWMLERYIAEALVKADHEDILLEVTNGRNEYEGGFDFVEAVEDAGEPSAAFLGASAKNGVECNETAAQLVQVFAPTPSGDECTIISPKQPGGECLISSLKVLRALGEDVSKIRWALIPDLKITNDFIIKGDVVMVSPNCFDSQSRMDEAIFTAFNEMKRGNWIYKKLRSLALESSGNT